MILSRSKPALNTNISNKNFGKASSSFKNAAQFEDYLEKRDYTGAITVLEFKQYQEPNVNSDLWIAYSAFHLGDYKRALHLYNNLYAQNPKLENIALNIACCYFYLGIVVYMFLSK